jgi:hypothetical protein
VGHLAAHDVAQFAVEEKLRVDGSSGERKLEDGAKNTPFEERAPLCDTHGETMMALFEELFPICRSITGNGVRQTLTVLRRCIPLEVNEDPSRTPVLDWTVPREWNIRDAYTG